MSSADTTITVELVPDHYAFMLACVGDTTPEAVTRFIRLAIEALMLELGEHAEDLGIVLDGSEGECLQ